METILAIIGGIFVIAILIKTFSPETSTALMEEYLNKAQVEHSKEDFLASIKILNDAIYLYPKYPQLWNQRGESKYALEDYQGALKDFENSLEIEPASHKNWDVHVNRQSCLDALAFAPLLSSKSINEFKEQIQSQQKKADNYLASFNPGRIKNTQHEDSEYNDY